MCFVKDAVHIRLSFDRGASAMKNLTTIVRESRYITFNVIHEVTCILSEIPQ